jgi:peptidyl-prolyl cis-trans isomerase A (cyclophilin A)
MTIRSLLTTSAAIALSASLANAQTPPPKPAEQKPAAQKPPAQKPAASKAALMNPAKLNETAPATYNAQFDTSAGTFVIEVTRAWAPRGADRFYNPVKNGFFDDARFFRVVSGFMVQFGINGDPEIQKHWAEANFPDDPVKQSNKRGFVTFAKRAVPNSRSTQVFINFGDNAGLDRQGFAPFGQVVSGMEVVDKLYSVYGEAPSQQQGRIQVEGNKFLNASYPRLDYIKTATIK